MADNNEMLDNSELFVPLNKRFSLPWFENLTNPNKMATISNSVQGRSNEGQGYSVQGQKVERNKFESVPMINPAVDTVTGFIRGRSVQGILCILVY
jgi:hypothetical protein